MKLFLFVVKNLHVRGVVQLKTYDSEQVPPIWLMLAEEVVLCRLIGRTIHLS